MPLPNIVFNRSEGGLGRPLPNNDNISGIIFYSDTLPSGFTASNRINKIYSIDDAENLGIVDTHSDETKATGGNAEITLTGATDDVCVITLDTAILGSYTVEAADADTDIAVGLRAAINALTYKHGFVASGSTVHIAIAAPDKCGLSINTGNALVAFTCTAAAGGAGTATATVTQFTSGVGSLFAVMHYHIKEFFRMQPKGNLYVGIYAVATYTGVEIQTVQDYTNGEIRQIAVYLPTETYAASHLSASQTYATLNRTAHKPLSVIFHADIYSSTLANFTSLASLTNADVSLVIGTDGNYLQSDYSNTFTYSKGDKVNWAGNIYIAKAGGTGNPPFESTYWSELVENLRDISGFSISTLGNTLGTVALAAVHENIGWPEKFDLASGNTLDVAGFGTGNLYNSQTDALLDTLNDYHYIFIRKFIGKTGTFYNDAYTAVAVTSDFSTIENNRAMDKAERNVYIAAIDKLQSPLYVNTDGTITEDTIAIFKNIVEAPVNQMEIDGEISGLSVEIDPEQDVLSTSTIIITLRLVPVGVARQIQINSGFTTITV